MRAFLAGRSIRTRETAAFLSLAFRNSRTFRSSASIWLKLGFDAYQRDAQARVTGRRKPVGWIFCPIVFLCGASVTDGHVDVAGTLADAIATTLCTGRETLQGGALFDVDRRDFQLVDIRAVVVLGIRDGAFQRLLDDAGSLLLRELEHVERVAHLLAADQVSHQTTLVGRKADAADDCFGFHRQLLSAWPSCRPGDP